MNINQGGRMRLLLGTLVATVAAAGGLAVVALGDPAHEHAAHEHAARAQASDHEHMAGAGADTKLGGAALRLHDRMRKLWEDHITWTRLTIVSFAAELPDLQPTLKRLLRNQQDIGDAIEPFYGPKAADRLTALLTEHINGAVDVLAAAKSGDQQAFEAAKRAWYENGRQVADFLHDANPSNWHKGEMRSMMRTHLDQTLKEGADRLAGDHRADIRDYEAIHRHILEMADELSSGLIAQFPGRFR
jgi:hypothetical protein